MINKKKNIILSLVAVSAISAGIVLGYNTMQKRRYEKNIQLGINYMRQENYKEAINVFNEAISIDSKKQEAYDYKDVSNTINDIKTIYDNGDYRKALKLIDTLKEMNHADVIDDKIVSINNDIESNLLSEQEVYAKLLKSTEWLNVHAEYDQTFSRDYIKFLPLDFDKDGSLDLLLYHEGRGGMAGLTLSVISYDKFEDKIIIRDINTGHGGYGGYLSDSNTIITRGGNQGSSYLMGWKLQNDKFEQTVKMFDDYFHYPEEESYKATYEIDDKKVSATEYRQHLNDIKDKMSNTEMYVINDTNIRKLLGVEPKRTSYDEIERYM